jgi:hypothetical protein
VLGSTEIRAVAVPACLAALERHDSVTNGAEGLPPLPDPTHGLLVLVRRLLIDMGPAELMRRLQCICDPTLWRLSSLLGPRADVADAAGAGNGYASTGVLESGRETASHADEGGPQKRLRSSTESDVENWRGENRAVGAGEKATSSLDMREGASAVEGMASSLADLSKRALVLRTLSAMVGALPVLAHSQLSAHHARGHRRKCVHHVERACVHHVERAYTYNVTASDVVVG